MKIVVLDGYTENPGDLSWKGFEKLGKLTVYDRTPEDLIVSRIRDAEAVLVKKTCITARTLEACPNIRYIGILSTGSDSVDVNAAKAKGIPVCNVPSYGTIGFSQLVFAHLLEVCHHVWAHNMSVKAGDWTQCEDFSYWNYPLLALAGKTMGIIGFGSVGQRTAQIAQSFGMKVLTIESHPDKSLESDTLKFVSMDELFKNSDVISLHCSLSPITFGIINRKSIAKMKDGVIIINTSRGQLIVEKDLAEALKSGKVYAACCDVASTEPIRADNPLLACENAIITPHISWAPVESRAQLMDIAVDNLKAFIKGAPINVVNK